MIAHVDADAFFASVLVRQNPSLHGKPLLALGMGGSCVIAASYEAKANGVKTGMRLKDALSLVPDALRLPSDFRETGLASHQIEAVLRETCPVMEQMSIDEWFLDLTTIVGGLPPDLSAFAENVRKDVLRRTGLSVSVGIAPSKLLAKMASEYRKPGGITVVATPASLLPHPLPLSCAQEREFLSDRPAASIPGIGPRRLVHCEMEGWHTAWDIAQAHPEELRRLFGRPGLEMRRELLGERVFPVQEKAAPQQSISRTRSFRAEGNRDMLWAHLLRHLEYAVLKIRRMRQAAGGISVWLRDGRYEYRSTHCSFPRPLASEETLQPFVQRCFAELYARDARYTQTGLALRELHPGGKRQLSLFEDPRQALREEHLQDSLDDIHERFGRNAVTRGAALQVKSGSSALTTGGTRNGFAMPVYD